MPNGVIGNTTDSGSVKSRFEPWLGNMTNTKKILNIFLVLSIVFLFTNCNKTEKIFSQKKAPGFVHLDEGVFKINDTTFFPLMINYKVSFRIVGDEAVLSPAKHYENHKIYESNTKEEINAQLNAHVGLMKELGFNTIRLCLDGINKDDIGLYYPSKGGRFYLKDDTEKLLSGISDALSIIKSYDMKVMLLLKPPFEKETENFTIELLKHFANDNTIFAYDFMNEPLYFDTEKNRKKEDAVKIVTEWREMANTYAPYQLFTIGFSEPIEVFEWDPSMLPVDFIQIHTYNPLRIQSEIWWYNKYCGKPWMIGETSLPADNDSVGYDLQYHFVDDVFQYVIDCGGIGFGWWEFQDHIAPLMNFEANYTGLINTEGTTRTPSGYEIIGTLKPAAYEFAKLTAFDTKSSTTEINDLRPINYFNMLGYENYLIKGKIEDRGIAVEGALIRGWNNSWRIGINTYSDENGEFTLYSNDRCVHFEISAPGYEKIKFDKYDLIYKSVNAHTFSDLKDIDLEYQDISFTPFIKSDSTIFDFKEDMFNKVKFETDMGNIELRKF